MINDIDIRGINNIPYTAYEYGNITGKGEYWKYVDGLLICKKHYIMIVMLLHILKVQYM